MNWRHIRTIARKDLREALGNTSVWLPMIIVPLIFVVVIPLVLILVSQLQGAESVLDDPEMAPFIQKLPLADLASLNSLQQVLVMMLGYFFAPMFLILPLMFSTTIAAESFAGERERKTIEALLYSPASDTELFLGKALAGLAPSLVISWLSFFLYAVVVNAASYPVFGRVWFPLVNWWPLIFWVTPALALLGVSMTVIISAKVKTFMGAYQASASTVVLVVALMAGQATGLLYLSPLISLIMGAVLFVVDVILLRIAVRTFNRKALLASA